MMPEQILKVIPDSTTTKLERKFLEIMVEKITDNAALTDKVNNLNAPPCGWLTFQGEVIFFSASTPLVLPADSGLLLNGEIVVSKEQSLHIREDGQGGWLATTFTEHEKTGEEVLSQSCKLLATGNKQNPKLFPALLYNRYWKHLESFGYHQYCARFTGFINEENLS